MEKACKFFLAAMLICIMSPRYKSADATDALFPGQVLSGNDTLTSKNGAFQLGFKCVYPPCSDWTPLGIRYVGLLTCKPLLVWEFADSHLSEPWTSFFNLSQRGNDPQLTSLTPYYTVLLDNGNLVVRDQVNSSLSFWQSFNNLGDILLPGGWLGFNINGPLMFSSEFSGSCVTSSYLVRNPADQPQGFSIFQSTNCSTDTRLHYSGTFPSWMGYLADEDTLFLSNNSDLYVRLDSDGTLTAAKLGGCGTLLWSAPKSDSSQEESYSMQHKSHSKIKTIALTTTAIGVLILLMLIGLVLFWIRRKMMKRPLNCNSTLMVFSEAQMKKATKSFSEKIGEGGFGCVFKGALPGFSLVPVKKLKGVAQGEKEFRAEVQTIGIIRHVNLVRLFGFCAQGRARLLVYEYMENGSLNSHLFSKSSPKLTWDLRYRIALGIARGLAYIHEECR
uniref:Uncharacterized protein n=1 Tax=Avena sativa TaxID=4498 RepID=A0ACD5VC16_AVESA